MVVVLSFLGSSRRLNIWQVGVFALSFREVSMLMTASERMHKELRVEKYILNRNGVFLSLAYNYLIKNMVLFGSAPRVFRDLGGQAKHP